MQEGNENYHSAPIVEQSFLVIAPAKKDQFIIFDLIADQFNDATTFVISASASSGLEVKFTVISGPASIDENTVKLTGRGQVTIQASQEGNNTYNAATPIERSFCIFPEKPFIEKSEVNDRNTIILTSSSKNNNQWLFNGEVIGGATNDNYEVRNAGEYSVQISIDSCISVSDVISITDSMIISPIEKFTIYPNPTKNNIYIKYAPANKQTEVSLQLYTILGVELENQVLLYKEGRWQGEVKLEKYMSGSYILVIKDGTNRYTKLVVKF